MNPSRLRVRSALALTLVAAFGANALAEGDAVSPKAGVSLELSLSNEPIPIGEEILSLGMLQGGLFLGYRTGRVTVGLGLDVDRLSASTSSDFGEDSTSLTEIVVMPGIRVTATSSADGRVESFVQADLGFGKTFFNDDDGGNDDESYSRITYQFGPGFRYWLHPQFAVGASAGLRGNFFKRTNDIDRFESSTGITAVYTSLQLTGVF